MYSLTFIGLYLEIAGAFLLAAEAIGKDNLKKVSINLRKHRLLGFIILVSLIFIIIAVFKYFGILHLLEAIILILSFGLIFDFAPGLINIIIKRIERGTLGVLGFILFSVGFSIQAYVNLSLLY